MAAQGERSGQLIGRAFVHPSFDYLFIGGGLSLLVTVMVIMFRGTAEFLDDTTLPYFILFSNSAHFAASTVRLYTKPDACKTRPFVTMGLPLVTLLLLTVCIFQAGRLGPTVQAIYLTWSPYHYAAQAYGLAVMYCYRSGCQLSGKEKNALWFISMVPFLYAFLTGSDVGIDWILPQTVLTQPVTDDFRRISSHVLVVLAFLTPLLLFVRVWRSHGRPLPIISLLVLFSNGIWWLVLSSLNAFAWATIFHGIQYLAIVMIIHVKDHMAQESNTHGMLFHVLWFYAVCLLLGYSLFNILPLSYMFVGFGRVESVLLVVATINIHHFIVDGYIWRLKKADTNRRVVERDIIVGLRGVIVGLKGTIVDLAGTIVDLTGIIVGLKG